MVVVKTYLKKLPGLHRLLAERDQFRRDLLQRTRERDALWKHRSFDPELVPNQQLIRASGVLTLEGWYRWAEEWSMLLRVYGMMRTSSKVLEIGCGLGRVGFAIRHILDPRRGAYYGFDIATDKIEFAQNTLGKKYPNYHFTVANLNNTFYNPGDAPRPTEYRFPYQAAAMDVTFAASVFTHMLPDATGHYFRETARVLKPGGRAVFSFFLFDHYVPGRHRPGTFSAAIFNFDHARPEYGDDFALADPANPEMMTAYRLAFVKRMAADAGLVFEESLPGMWSGAFDRWLAMQDIVVLRKPESA